MHESGRIYVEYERLLLVVKLIEQREFQVQPYRFL